MLNKKWGKLISLILAVLIAFASVPSFSVFAANVASGTCGANLTWTLDSNGLLTISGTGDMYDYSYQNSSPWDSYSDSVRTVEIQDGVTSIGNRAFYNCTVLKNIIISDSVTSIGDEALWCCRELTELTIPDGVTSIGENAFSWCEGLESITIANSVTSIGGYAFYYCTKLESVTIPDSVTSIESHTFFFCYNLKSVTIGKGVTSIEDSAFFDCGGLTSITIPDSVISIGPWAFEICKGLTSIVIPDGVTSIFEDTFKDCIGLTTITIPASLTYISEGAFYNCNELTTVNYAGTEEQRNQVRIDSENDYLVNATWIYNYSDTEIIASGICGDNLTWTLDSNGLLTISGTGGMYDYDYNTFPWYSYCDTINAVEFEGEVTSIGDYAFYYCTGLASITIPDSVTSIGYSAFCGCTGLTSITIPDSVTSIGNYAFYGCTGLTSITIPDSVTAIGYSAFGYCTGLTSIIIPDSVISIDQFAFSRCTNLISILVDEENQYYSSEDGILFNKSQTEIVCYPAGKTGDYAIPSKITSINSSAFCGCKGLTSVTIPNNVTFIGYGAFCDCTGLTSVAIPNNITSINDDAFNGCTGLTSVTIPNSVTSIGWMAFLNCSGLTTVYYTGTEEQRNQIEIYDYNDPLINATWVYNYSEIEIIASGTCGDNLTWTLDSEGLLTISGTGGMYIYSVFDPSPWDSYRDSIENVEIQNGVTSIGKDAFYKCTGLTSVTIPEGVISIGYEAFCNCTGLTSVTIPDSVTSIGSSAFESCTGLTSITIPDSVTSIGAWAFDACTGLESITVDGGNKYYHSAGNCLIKTASKTLVAGCKNSIIPNDNSVTSIGDYAFSYCKGLTSITIPDNVTSIGHSAFYNCSGLTTVNYTGTEEQRNQIEIEVNNDPLINATWIYNYVEIEIIASGTCGDNLTWTLDSTGLLTISGTGKMYDFTSASPWYSYRDSINSVEFDGEITSIGMRAFSGCSSLTGVTIPDSVTNIGYMAFSDCSQLSTVYYTGIEKQRNRITIDSENDYLINATWYCKECEHENTEIRNAVYATCTQNGYTGDTYCLDCDEKIADGEVIFSPGHIFNDWEVVIPFSCVTDGLEQRICTVCGEVEEQIIPAHHNEILLRTVAPTCTEGGCDLLKCTVCGLRRQINFTEALGHSYVHVGTIEPTCTEKGFDIHSCEICGDTYYDNYTKPHGHSYVHVGTIEPTCTEQGFDVHSCEICGDTYYDNYTETIEHNYRFRSTVATSCVKAGYHLYTCTGCGGTKKTQIPALGHYFVDGFCADCGVSEIVAPLDLNGDTEANAADLVIIVNSLIADEEYNDLYDLNHDGNVNILDLIVLKKQLANMV